MARSTPRPPTRLERAIALRYLRGRKRSKFASLNTIIAVGGVAIGVMALIVVLGVMNGLRDDLRDKILVANPHLRILTYGSSLRMDDWREALDTIRRHPEVVAAAPEVLTQALILNQADYPSAVNLVGVEVGDRATSVTALRDAIESGDGDFTLRSNPDSVSGAIILGYRLAGRLSAYVGDIVTIVPPTSARVNRATGQRIPQLLRFEVTGIFNTGMYQYDDGFGVMELATAQQVAGLDSAVTGLQIRLRDAWQAPDVGKQLEARLGYPYRSFDWQSQNESLFAALQLEKLAMGLIICFIMVVAAFNIIGTLTMVVAEKTREIGILQAMGLTRGAVSRIFLAQGAIIGGVGTAIGLVLGLAASVFVDRSGLIKIDPQVYFIDHLPVHIEIGDVIGVVAFSLIVAVVATFHPSRTASRLTPVEAIRHE